MKELILALFLIISQHGFCQLRSVVIDKDTKDVIPYVNIWIEGEHIGTTSNINGEFELNINKSDTIIFSAIGYATKRIRTDYLKDTVKLSASVIRLDEVVVVAPENDLDLTIGKFRKYKIHHYYAVGTEPWIVARYFPYKETYSRTRFLKKIKILTNSDVQDAKFNIRLYKKNKNDEPGDYLYHQNIIGIAKKGKKINTIDLSQLQIKFPEEGFFMAFEWLMIEENIFEYEVSIHGSNEKLKRTSFEPSIGTILVDTGQNSWLYLQGKWRTSMKQNSEVLDSNQGKYSLLAVELTLTN